nr:hypothetical protein [Nonomuraea fuscirosea]
MSSGFGFLADLVAKPPGSIMVTLTPKPTTSPASDSFRASSAHLEAWCAPPSGMAMSSAAEDIWMMCPDFCSRKYGSAAWTTQNA